MQSGGVVYFPFLEHLKESAREILEHAIDSKEILLELPRKAQEAGPVTQVMML